MEKQDLNDKIRESIDEAQEQRRRDDEDRRRRAAEQQLLAARSLPSLTDKGTGHVGNALRFASYNAQPFMFGAILGGVLWLAHRFERR